MVCVEPAGEDLSPRSVLSIPPHQHDRGPTIVQLQWQIWRGTRLFGGLREDCLGSLMRLFCVHIRGAQVSPILSLLVYIPCTPEVVSD